MYSVVSISQTLASVQALDLALRPVNLPAFLAHLRPHGEACPRQIEPSWRLRSPFAFVSQSTDRGVEIDPELPQTFRAYSPDLAALSMLHRKDLVLAYTAEGR